MRMFLTLAALGWLATVADAQEDSLRKALIRGSPKIATMTLRRVSKKPGTVYAVARLAADMAFKLSSEDWEDAIEFADALVAHADTSSDDGLALFALAEAHIVRARVVRAALSTLGNTRLPEDSPLGALQENDAASTSYKKATELLLKSYAARQQEGDALARAVGVLAERAQADPGTAAELLTQAADLAQKVIKHNATSDRAANADAAVALMRARHELPTAKQSKEILAIRTAIEETLNRLKPADNARTEDIEFPTKYNEMVTFIKENKKKLPLKKLEYVTDGGSAIGSLNYRIPRSRFWAKGSWIKHWNGDGVLLRMITFDDYRFDTEYTVGVKGIGGDNAKGLCSDGISSSRELFVKIKRERKAVKGRLNRKIKGAYYYHIGGYDEHDLFLQVRGYYFKNMDRRKTQHVLFLEWVDSKKLDPEGKYFVDSLHQR